jgi:hypothetical protein
MPDGGKVLIPGPPKSVGLLGKAPLAQRLTVTDDGISPNVKKELSKHPEQRRGILDYVSRKRAQQQTW